MEKPASQKKTFKHIKAIVLAVFAMLLVLGLGVLAANGIMLAVVGHGQEILVPVIANINFNTARRICMKNDLYMQVEDKRHSDTIEKGNIISQKPEANTKTKKNRIVNVVISLGPEEVKVPYLDNITPPEAILRLQNMELKVGKKISRYSDVISAGKIISSVPLGEDYVPKGSSVDIIISMGKVPSSEKKNTYWKLLEKDGE